MQCEICQEKVDDLIQHVKDKHPNRPDYLDKISAAPSAPSKPSKTWPPK
jgi:hypothetical protein